ncbi:MAG: hypothetical protein LVS60_13585 [Nodosilinea sp. LVE1205-7]|jgi:predicted permease
MLLATGEAGLSRLVLFDLAQAIYLLTVIYALSAWFGQGQVTPRRLAQNLVQTPFFWAIMVGLALNLLGSDRCPYYHCCKFRRRGSCCWCCCCWA